MLTFVISDIWFVELVLLCVYIKLSLCLAFLCAHLFHFHAVRRTRSRTAVGLPLSLCLEFPCAHLFHAVCRTQCMFTFVRLVCVVTLSNGLLTVLCDYLCHGLFIFLCGHLCHVVCLYFCVVTFVMWFVYIFVWSLLSLKKIYFCVVTFARLVLCGHLCHVVC